MTLDEKVTAVTNLFGKLDKEISVFQSRTGLHCPAGCGKCCVKPDIEATVLEFLPFAHYLHKAGFADAWLEKDIEAAVCHILNPTQAGQGLCSNYVHRGLICRLFGYSARTTKYGKPELVTCTVIKEQEPYARTRSLVETGQLDIPVMNRYYMQLLAIDMELARNFYPINRAIRKAIETVLHYYAYRNE
jgi:Fe-S-cluster containining protein